MINEIEALSLAETSGMLKEGGESEHLQGFIKTFTKIKSEEAEKMRKELVGLGLLKIKSREIAKIIDTMPEDKEDLNKIATDVSLDENEAQTILNILNKYR